MTKQRAQIRREQLAKMRAAQRRRERRAALLVWGIGGLVIVLLVGAVAAYLIRERSLSSLDEVKVFDYKGAMHRYSKVQYKETPPVGGEHHPAWQNCGVYTEPINNEHAVHSLEHGAVWITYRPDLPKDQVEKLTKLASADFMLLSPYPGLPSPIVVSAWNRQLALQDADDPRLPRFIAKFKQNAQVAPEVGASCSGAVGETAAQAPIPEVAPSPTGPIDMIREGELSPSPSATADAGAEAEAGSASEAGSGPEPSPGS